MHIKFVEIGNFRKLKAVRVEFSEQKTIFVGANNSGKTSAMTALRSFLLGKGQIQLIDFTLSNWQEIDAIGECWDTSKDFDIQLPKWNHCLPFLDVWIEAKKEESHRLKPLIPTLNWDGGLLGVRLCYEPKDWEKFHGEYLQAKKAVDDLKTNAQAQGENVDLSKLKLWPEGLRDFLERKITSLFQIKAYLLDETALNDPDRGYARPQAIPAFSEVLETNPLDGLIHIEEINAQRGFSDVGSNMNKGENVQSTSGQRRLSDQLRAYYSKHLNPDDLPGLADLEALKAIYEAQEKFDVRLGDSFKTPIEELQEVVGYPGFTDPKISVSTKLQMMDAMNHESAVQYQIHNSSSSPMTLPEQSNGLGYQNLISMTFQLMQFRDKWMQAGKMGKRKLEELEDINPAPILLVLVEEPEAHLHAQVQQVFIREAYNILRNHPELGEKGVLSTQLVVSTHSSHVAHECPFEMIRYFKRCPANSKYGVPTSTVVNLSDVFGVNSGDTAKFVSRYLKATHCDLFFADAAVLIEGPAERMLVPHFVEGHFKNLKSSYLTILEIGGSHAHRLRPLIEKLGLITLVITDLDAVKEDGNKDMPQIGVGQKTDNSTLKTWIPQKENLDDVLSITEEELYDKNFPVRVAYQRQVKVALAEEEATGAIPSTFEDALVLANISLFKEVKGTGLVKKFSEAVTTATTPSDLAQKLYGAISGGDKAKFALDILYDIDPEKINPPSYIEVGLQWVEEQLIQGRFEVSIAKTEDGDSTEVDDVS
ncbi:AAA family ATPase [Terasakiella pusilla]|uniref:AAA family ATPase n=1 Tax=Terasakiella pusilla TaxID=64973 RepID=UPI003AA7C5B8